MLGNAVYAACQWGMITAMARDGSAAMVGRFALGLAIAGPIVMFTTAQLRNIQVTDTRGDYSFQEYMTFQTLSSLVALLAIGTICLSPMLEPKQALIVFLVGVAKIIESASEAIFGLLQQHERLDLVAKSQLLKGPLSLGALWLGLWRTENDAVAVCALAVAWAVLFVGVDLRNAVWLLKRTGQSATGGLLSLRMLVCSPHAERLRTLLKLALPLGVMSTLISANVYIPRFFLQGHFGESTLGIFAALAYFMVAFTVVTSAISKSALVRLTNSYATHDARAFQRLLMKLVLIGGLLAGGGVLVAIVGGEWLLTLRYGAQYAKPDVFLLIMFSAGLMGVGAFLNCGTMATRSFVPLMWLYFVVALVSLGTSIWLVPRYGLQGAALTIGISAVVHIVGSVMIIHQTLTQQRRVPVGQPGESCGV